MCEASFEECMWSQYETGCRKWWPISLQSLTLLAKPHQMKLYKKVNRNCTFLTNFIICIISNGLWNCWTVLFSQDDTYSSVRLRLKRKLIPIYAATIEMKPFLRIIFSVYYWWIVLLKYKYTHPPGFCLMIWIWCDYDDLGNGLSQRGTFFHLSSA